MAVLLNANAKLVSEEIQAAIAHILSPEDIFLSRTLSDAHSIAREVVDRGYDTVFTGGGDGTFVGFLNEILDCMELRQPVPVSSLHFGLLKLGTGNALAGLMGASSARGGRLLDDLLRARAGNFSGLYQLDLLDVEGIRCPFAGLGLDAAVINDYAWIKSHYRGALHWLGEGKLGYGFAVAGRTLPRFVAGRHPTQVEIYNAGSSAFRLGHDGKPIGKAIEHGEILYRGPVKIVAGGTVPNFGFDFRFFPFARQRRGKMHLRIFSGSALGVIGHLPGAWKGEYFPSGIHDFSCDRAFLRFDRPLPLQVGGDAKGDRQEIVLGMADRTVNLLSFNGQLAC